MDKDQLRNLYLSGKSVSQVARTLNCSIHKVVYWMDVYGISRRSRSAAGYLQHNPNGDPFKIKRKLSPSEKFLKGVGLGIYWGEGTKTTKYSLRVANTDPAVIKVFREFLRHICLVREDKITYSIVSFNDTDPEVSRSYWSKQLGILPTKFGKITIIPKQGKGTYKKKSAFGVCTIQLSNIKLRSWVMGELENIQKSLVSSTAERALGKG